MSAPGMRSERAGPSALLTAAALLVLVAACTLVFASSATREFGHRLIRENGPIEMATFTVFLAGGVIALMATSRGRLMGTSPALLSVIGGFAIAWLFAGMEEISWGQSLIGFSSPAVMQRVNVQNEINLHNLEGVQNLHSFLLFVLGTVGLVCATTLDRWRFPELRIPGSVRVCFAVVAMLGLFDWITDNFPFGDPADTVIGMLAEVNEMVLALAGLLFAIELAARFTAVARVRETLADPARLLD